ncbi:MAG: dTMP kinase [Planctomycetota bacterium]|nr:dTMP kinase [Planctomycetota bacterium]
MAPAPAHTADRAPLFVVLDGVDGCGKTTQARRLVEHLSAARPEGSREPLHLREPGSTAAGERIRELLLDPSSPMGRGTLALLFTAARRETLESLVAPALAAGRDVVVERFHASTFAYQGGGPQGTEAHAFDDEELLGLLHGWAGAPRPTVEIVLDVPPTDAFARAMARAGGGDDRFESRGLEFQEAVARAMRAYVERVEHAVVVDGTGDVEAVARRVLDAVLPAEARRA